MEKELAWSDKNFPKVSARQAVIRTIMNRELGNGDVRLLATDLTQKVSRGRSGNWNPETGN